MLDNMGCGDGKPVIVLPPDPGQKLGIMWITYKIRDPHGQEASNVLPKNVCGHPC